MTDALHSWWPCSMSSTQSIYVINLVSRTDRRLAMQQQLSHVGWQAEFFPAIRPESAADFPSIGAHGCFLSHLSVLKKARDAGALQVIILEDDLNFTSGFAERWKSSMSELAAQEWSIYYPGHSISNLPKGLSRVAPDTGVLCTHFMVINGTAIPTLIAGLETILSRPGGHPLGGPMHLDGAYSTMRAQNHALLTYADSPALGYQRSSRTDVGELKWFDRISFVSPIIDFARKLRVRS
jgi:glycosyl transferase, family 25